MFTNYSSNSVNTGIEKRLWRKSFLQAGPCASKGMNMSYVVSEYFNSLRDGVLSESLPLSDAMLATIRLLRQLAPDIDLTWLSKELLGYEDTDVFELRKKLGKGNAETLLSMHREGEPLYRITLGIWIPTSLLNAETKSGNLLIISEESIFFQGTMCELESLVLSGKRNGSNYVIVKSDQAANNSFLARTEHLSFSYYSAKRRFIKFIEEVLSQLSKLNAKK
jgi:hypothetical protein